MKISNYYLPFSPCKSSTMIACSDVDKDTAEGLALLLGYVVQDFKNDLDFILGDEVVGTWIKKDGELALFIDEGSDAEMKYNSLGGDEWIKKLLTGRTNPV